MAGPTYTQDVVLDADGKPVLDAFAAVFKEVEKLKKAVAGIGITTVEDAKKWQAALAQNVALLKKAQSDLNALSVDRTTRSKGFAGAEKAARDRAKVEADVDKKINDARLIEAKNTYKQIEAAHKAQTKAVVENEKAGANTVSAINKARKDEDLAADKARIASAKEVRRARMEALGANAKTGLRGLSDAEEARKIKADSDARLNNLRREREAVAKTDAAGAKSIEQRLMVEKAFNRELDTTISKLDRARAAADSRFTGLGVKDAKLLATPDVRARADVEGRAATLRLYQEEQRTAIERLRLAKATVGTTAEERVMAQNNLALANARVTAAQRLVNEENRVLAAEERQQRAQQKLAQQSNQPPGKTPIQNILTPQYAGAAVARTALYGAAAGLAYGAFNAISGQLSTVVELEDELKKLQAIANATDPQLQRIRGSIFAIAAESRFATVDLAKISQTLAQAGVGVGDMEKVLSSVTMLATASGSTPDEAVNLVTSALGSFQLQASEAARVADLMATALNRTKLTVQQTGQAIQYVGATAFEQNISLEEMLATVGAISQAGVKSGSTIGTGFRQFLVDLQTPSEKLTKQLTSLGLTQADVSVSTRGLGAVLQTLEKAGFGSSQAYGALETRAAAFYLTAKNNLDIVDQLQLAFQSEGAAVKANERAMDSLTAQSQRFMNIVTEMTASGADGFFKVLKDSIRDAADALEWYNSLSKDKEGNKTSALRQAVGFDLDSLPDWDFTKATIPLTGAAAHAKFLAEKTREAAAEQEVLETKLADTGDAASTQQGRIAELQKEYLRLLTQGESLNGNHTKMAVEMSNLMGRFEGLSGYLTNTKNDYLDLTNAVLGFTQAQQRSLSGTLARQGSNLANLGEASRSARTGLLGTLRQNQDYGKLSASEKAAVGTVYSKGAGTDEFARALQVLGDAGKRFATNTNGLGKAIDNLVTNMSEGQNYVNQGRVVTTQQRTAAASGTAQGRDWLQRSTDIGASLAKATAGDDKAAKAATGQIDSAEAWLKSWNPRPEYKAFFDDAKRDLQAFRAQVKAVLEPTAAETKAATKAAREAKAAEREANKKPPFTQADLDKAGQALGLPLGSGVRSKATQNALHAAGKTKATGDTSSHSNGNLARDFPTGNMPAAEAQRLAATLRAQLRAQGVDANVKWESGQGKNNGTGPHIHVNAKKGQGKSAGRADINEDQYAAQLAESQVSLNKATLNEKYKDIANASTDDGFKLAVASADAALKVLNESLTNEALLDLATAGIAKGSPQYEARMKQVTQETANNTAEFQQKVADNIVKSIDAQLKAAQNAFDTAMLPAENKLALAQAQSTGLSAFSLRGRVPDYVAQLAEDRVARAQEGVTQATYNNMPAQIAATETSLRSAKDKLGSLTDPGAVEAARAKIAELNIELAKLVATREALGVQLGAEGLIPTSLSQGLNQAIEAYRNANNLTATFSETLTMNMGGAIEQVHTGLTEMFTSIFDGSQTALQAFGNFAKGIMNWITQMVAKFIASKIMDFFLGIITGSVGGGGGGVSLGARAGVAAFNGGLIGEDGYLHRAGGGLVENGSKAMDSVRTKLAKGEFVMQNSAVDSVGTQFMAKLNQHGAKALDSLGAMPKIDMKTRTETNVYVVPPEQRPTLGKNDVIIYMQDEMLNGDSRRLIQHISREG